MGANPCPEAVPRIMPRMDRVRPIEPPPALELGLGRNPENLEGRERGTGSHPGRAQPALALEVTGLTNGNPPSREACRPRLCGLEATQSDLTQTEPTNDFPIKNAKSAKFDQTGN